MKDLREATAEYSGPFTAPEPLELAADFPQLEIIELLGQGGMGAVYKARQTKLDRLIALKVLPPAAGKDPSFAERFTREARALARLNHPNIVTVYDFGQAGDLCYFMMEYVDGLNLRRALQAGRMQPQEALKIVPQICDALQFAHDEGIVHRDVKPENILLDKRGRVKIADFGIAKILGRNTGIYTLTGPWQVVGTLHYMAPEQIDNPLKVDHRADIYSLGVVFYEMLTGQLPLGRFPPPSQKVAVDVRLDQVVLRALENEPDRRYQRASEVKTEVEAITVASGAAPIRTPPTSQPFTQKPAAALRVKCSMYLGMWEAPGLLRLDENNLSLEIDAGITKSKYKDIQIPLSEIESLRLSRKWFKGVLLIRGRKLRSLSNVPGHQEGKVEFEIAGEDFALAEQFVATVDRCLSGASSIVEPDVAGGKVRELSGRVVKPAVRAFVRGGMSFVRQLRTFVIARPEQSQSADTPQPPRPLSSPMAPQALPMPGQAQTPVVPTPTPATRPPSAVRIPSVLPAPPEHTRPPAPKPATSVEQLLARARRDVRFAAALLLCVGLFNTLVLTVLLVLAAVSSFTDTMGDSAPTLRWLTLVGISGPPVIWGARQMRSLSSYRMAVTAAVLAMLPPCPVLGVPAGIWALWILTRGRIKEAFRLRRQYKTSLP
jgi:serine/threonine protein kinase